MVVETVQIEDTTDPDNQDGDDDASIWHPHPGYGTAEQFRVSDGTNDDRQGGVRFDPVAVPSGATINSATITLWNKGSNTGGMDTLIIKGDDVDDAAAWGASSRPQNGFTDTTYTATINSITTGADNSTEITVTGVVAEIVALGGWETGQAMRFRIETTDSYITQLFWDYESPNSAGMTALLTIDYTAGGGGGGGGIVSVLGGALLGPMGGPF